MPTVSITISKSLTSPIEALRQTVYGKSGASTSDEFDPSCFHISAVSEKQVAGYVRVDPNGPRILSKWLAHPLPEGLLEGDVSFSRAMVHPAFRRRGIYRLLMQEAVTLAGHLGRARGVAAIEPAFSMRRFLEELGFRGIGNLHTAVHPETGKMLVQTIAIDLSPFN